MLRDKREIMIFTNLWKRVKPFWHVTYKDLVIYMYKPKDPSSLGIIRFLFGLLMVIDVTEERGGSEIDIRWGNNMDCHFPLAPIFRPLSYSYMCLLYGAMWLGAMGIMLGYRFRASAIVFGLAYWYILLMDKSYWNNHSYLYGILTILFVASSANHFFSIDSLMDLSISNQPIPHWNYFILKYQFFILYFLAGLKKSDSEWLQGYSVMDLGEHWVFYPFRIFLTTHQIDYLIIHWFGFILDLTIAFWMLLEFSRPIAMTVCALFHLMNSRLFSIGMFPYVCLVTMPLFCKEDWPRKFSFAVMNFFNKKKKTKLKTNKEEDEKLHLEKCQSTSNVKFKQKLVVFFLLTHMGLQVFLPYSHFITKGYNNWTNGLYGYSWDMMVHSWDTVLVVVKIVDNESGREYFLDSQAWSHNNRWSQHADMCLQYAHCIDKNLKHRMKENSKHQVPSKNISIFIDVWCSLNKRFQQRMYEPNYDLMKANWSPFEPVEWLMPVLSEYNDFRRQMAEITEKLHSWNNESDVMFIADFPGLYLENYINEDLENVSLTVLIGEVIYEMENENTMQSVGVRIKEGDYISIPVGFYHKVHTISKSPSCYMYIYTRRNNLQEDQDPNVNYKQYSPFPFIEDFSLRKRNLFRMIELIWNATTHLFFGAPLNIISTNLNDRNT